LQEAKVEPESLPTLATRPLGSRRPLVDYYRRISGRSQSGKRKGGGGPFFAASVQTLSAH
jgi:hypothetical protein